MERVSIRQFETSEEFNISSYLDFAKATLDLIMSKMINETTGFVYKSADHKWEIIEVFPGLPDFYWAITSLHRMYEVSVAEGHPNTTLSIAISNMAIKMVELFLDQDYPGYGVDLYSIEEYRTTKRAGIQSYAYQALRLAESVNSSLDFTTEKQSAIDCLTNMLYDNSTGGFFYYTTRNGSLDVPETDIEVYPNDGKRLDHTSLGAMALYDAGVEQGNSTLIAMANATMNFIRTYMREYFQSDYFGLRLAVNRTGGHIPTSYPYRASDAVVTEVDSIALRAFLKAYRITNDTTYLDLVRSTVKALLEFSWDREKGGWFVETLEGVPYDPLDDEDVKYYKMSETQFQMVMTLEELYEITDNLFYLRTSIDTLELTLMHLWDILDGGFIQNGDQDWVSLAEDWQWHHTSVQGHAILALQKMWSYGLPIISNVRINPTAPRPTDEVFVSTTVLDADGVDYVYVNYTASNDETTSSGVFELEPNAEAGGVFNSSFGFLNDSTTVNFYVIANDSLGNDFIVGIYNFIVRLDIWEPAIILRRIYPDEVYGGDEVILEFGTYEYPIHSATLCCRLSWKLNTGFYNYVNMTLVGVDENDLVWQISLGTFRAGDVIAYYAEAFDESGNVGVSSFYRLTILGATVYVSPLAAWQIVATIGLISAPGAGVAYVWSRRRYARTQQRELKKEARKRGRRKRGAGRSRSRTDGGS